MKKRVVHILLCMLLVAMMIPTTAFAGTHELLSDLDLTSGDHSGSTLENAGYTWNAETHTLTMQDLKVWSHIKLPNVDCQIYVKGNCSADTIEDSNGGSAVTVTGEAGALFSGGIRVSGNLTLKNLTMTDATISNSNVGSDKILQLNNSNITLKHLSWMTDGGISLIGSQLEINKENNDFGQFWVERIAMDDSSKIKSNVEMMNFGHFTPEQQGLSDDYIAVPAGGHFGKITEETQTDKSLTIFDSNGNVADHFILRAPEPVGEQCKITLTASPAEGGTVSGAGQYEMGTKATITAQANKGYHFVQWQDYEGKAVSKDASYQFTVEQTADYTAVFEKGDAVAPSENGGTDQNGKSGSDSARTGDSSMPVLFGLIALLAAGGAAGALYRRKKA